MAFFKSPEEMYTARAKSFRSSADRHWSMAKSGQGGFHYAAARKDYEAAEHNEACAKRAHDTNATFAKHKCKKQIRVAVHSCKIVRQLFCCSFN